MAPAGDGGRKGFAAVWMASARHVGLAVGAVLSTVVYFTIAPFFSLVRFSDPLAKKLDDGETYWQPRRRDPDEIERYRRLF